MKFNERYAVHPKDFKKFDTNRIRKEFLVKEVFVRNEICLTYSLYDRYIVGGANPVTMKLELESFDSLKADSFLARREMGIINVGGKGTVVADGETYEMNYKEALYLGEKIGCFIAFSKAVSIATRIANHLNIEGTEPLSVIQVLENITIVRAIRIQGEAIA